jgi:ADP-heptose:LPS heptosyltransferase
MVEVLKKLNIDLLLAVGPHDQHVRNFYTQEWRNDIQTINLDLEGIARYYLNFKCVAMPDTGPMHLVAALDIPLVQIFVDSQIKQYAYHGSKKYIIDKKLDTDAFTNFIREQLNLAQ